MIEKGQLADLLNIVDKAIALIQEHKNKKYNIFYKDDGSEYTDVDLMSDDLICGHLQKKFPEIPIISEERVSSLDIQKLMSSEYIWMIDPLDGTKGYINKGRSYTINIALLKNRVPILGIIAVPEDYTTYYCYQDVIYKKSSDRVEALNMLPFNSNLIRVVISKRADPEHIKKYLMPGLQYEIHSAGGARKFLGLASGDFDIFPRYTPTSEWDVAAGDAILRACGGGIYDSNMQKLSYLKNDFKNGHLFTTRSDQYLEFFCFS